MQLITRASEFPLTQALQAFVERRLSQALGRYRHVIRSIRVSLRDLNGPRHGRDKRCQLELELAGQPALVISQTDADMYRAIGLASRRADRQIARRLDRRHGRGQAD